MVSQFPELLWLVAFAPVFLRIGLGLVLFLTSFHQIVDQRLASTQRFSHYFPKYGHQLLWAVSVTEIILGLAIFAGIYTQVATLLTALLATVALLSPSYRKATKRDSLFYMLMLSISLSLVITGAGLFAFDLPL